MGQEWSNGRRSLLFMKHSIGKGSRGLSKIVGWTHCLIFLSFWLLFWNGADGDFVSQTSADTEGRLTKKTYWSGDQETWLLSCYYLTSHLAFSKPPRPPFSLLKVGRLTPLSLPHGITGRTGLISQWALKTMKHVMGTCMCVCKCVYVYVTLFFTFLNQTLLKYTFYIHCWPIPCIFYGLFSLHLQSIHNFKCIITLKLFSF